MARKNTVVFPLAVAQSMASSFITNPTLIKNLDNIAYQINITTSDSIGVFTVQASLDYAIDETVNKVTNPGNWIDLALAGGVPFAAAANDSIIIDLNQLPFNAIRLKYTATTPGTGTCDAFIMCKQLGG